MALEQHVNVSGQEENPLEETTVKIFRCSKVVKGGRRFSFAALNLEAVTCSENLHFLLEALADTDNHICNQCSHCTVEMAIPKNVKIDIAVPATRGNETPAEFTISSVDKCQLGQFAAEIRKVRPPEPYKGKGIRYADEYIKRKVGKAFASGTA